ncbi:MAG: hypothetical protein ACRD1Z_07615, partial [Vicinamibacteria bacterium]
MNRRESLPALFGAILLPLVFPVFGAFSQVLDRGDIVGTVTDETGAGVINVVTQSAGNDWRGSGFLFLRDEALTADDPFGNAPN